MNNQIDPFDILTTIRVFDYPETAQLRVTISKYVFGEATKGSGFLSESAFMLDAGTAGKLISELAVGIAKLEQAND
jgi:hypothetical protein